MMPAGAAKHESRVTTRRRAGFTLIELLVVVAIIALLIAILLPALRAARQQARGVTCLSNTRQLALAWRDYLDENRGFFLQGINVNYNYGGVQGTNQFPWPPLHAHDRIPKPLNRYLKLDPVLGPEYGGVFRCPCDTGSATARPTNYAYYGTSYMTNLMLIAQDELNINPTDPVGPVLDQVNLRLPRLNVSRVTTNHAELLLIADGGWWNSQTIEPMPRIEWHDRRGFHNAAFLDGHARFVQFRKGLYVTKDYTLIPFRDLAQEAGTLQQPAPDE